MDNQREHIEELSEDEVTEEEITDESDEENEEADIERIRKMVLLSKHMYDDIMEQLCKDVRAGLSKVKLLEKYRDGFNKIFHETLHMVTEMHNEYLSLDIAGKIGETEDHFAEQGYKEADKMAYEVHKTHIEKTLERLLEVVIDANCKKMAETSPFYYYDTLHYK